MSPLVAAYVDLYNRQKNLKRLQEGKKDEFFGLRDFYRYKCHYFKSSTTVSTLCSLICCENLLYSYPELQIIG